jgi:hypothetical protein
VSSLKLVEAPASQPIPIDLHSRQEVAAKAALEELYQLLEDYGPAWYTEEHHERAVRALQASLRHTTG